jgi:threonine dehydratase
VGKVLVGFEVPPLDYPAFDAFLEELDFHYEEETANGVYREFLWEGSK